MMNKNTLKKRKGGFSLVECVVALLLFSIVIGAVLTAFTSSHKQIDTQTDQYKIDLMSSNILAAYQGSNNKDSFNELMIDLGADPRGNRDFGGIVNGEDDGEGEGVYSFDPQNVPIDPVAFNKIHVIDNTATIYGTDGAELVSFDGYEGNKLPTVEGISWDSLYTGKETVHYNSMSISGKADIYRGKTITGTTYGLSDCTYTYTVTLNPDEKSGKTNFSVQNNDKSVENQTGNEREACEFELYLLTKGWYLDCIYRKPGEETTYPGTPTYKVYRDVFYFSVKDSNGNQVTNKIGNKFLYYKITVATVAEDGLFSSPSYDYDGLYTDLSGNDPKAYLDFSNITDGEEGYTKIEQGGTSYYNIDVHGKMEFAYGYENADSFSAALVSAGSESTSVDFDNNFLTKEGGSYFTGRWYYFPWLVANTVSVKTEKDKTVYKQITEGVPSIRGSNVSEYVPLSDHGKNEYEYTPKAGVNSNIFYAYTKGGEVLLFNSEDTLVFKCENGIDAPLNDLKGLGYGNKEGKRNTQALYNEITYDKWYIPGAVPDKEVRKVKFEDNPDGISRIIFRGNYENVVGETDFITYSYSKENYDNFVADRQSILDFEGSYSDKYIYTKDYTAKSPKTITDADTLKGYEKYLPNVSFGTTSVAPDSNINKKEITVAFYSATSEGRLDGWSRYDYTYTYYIYKITKTRTVSISQYKEDSKALTMSRNGAELKGTETIHDTITVSTIDTYKIESVSNGSAKVTVGLLETPKTPSVITSCDAYYSESDIDKKDKALTYWLKDKVNKNATATSDSYEADPTTATYKNIVPGRDNLTYDDFKKEQDKWNLSSESAKENEFKIYDSIRNSLKNNRPITDGSELIGFELVLQDGEDGTTVFTANTPTFIIEAKDESEYSEHSDYSISSTGCTYNTVSGGSEKAPIVATTYYYSWTTGKTTLIVEATYSNSLKEFAGKDGNVQSIEPKIAIWIMPKDKAAPLMSDPSEVVADIYKEYLQYEYRKG